MVHSPAALLFIHVLRKVDRIDQSASRTVTAGSVTSELGLITEG